MKILIALSAAAVMLTAPAQAWARHETTGARGAAEPGKAAPARSEVRTVVDDDLREDDPMYNGKISGRLAATRSYSHGYHPDGRSRMILRIVPLLVGLVALFVRAARRGE